MQPLLSTLPSPLAVGILFALCALTGTLSGCDSLAGNNHGLAGVWIVESPSPQGAIPETVEFRETDQGMSGVWRIWFNGTSQAHKLGEIELLGTSLSFRRGPSGDVYKGTFTQDDQFEMNEVGQVPIISNGVPVLTLKFRRLSDKEFVEMKANAPTNLITHRLPLPALRDLPPNDLALTPPMGWSSWNSFMATIDASTVRETADAMVSSGLRDAGYVYVNIDDGWQGRRDAKGVLHPNAKFPDMKALADYIHSKGLKFGMYTAAAPISCTSYIGSHGYVEQDVKTFAEWGADYVKYDWCFDGEQLYTSDSDIRAVSQQMAEALRATGRPIVYSCAAECAGSSSAGGGRKAGENLWPNGTDDAVNGERWHSMSARFDVVGRPEDNGPGGWNDPDMMLIGMDGLTNVENHTHMTLWCMRAGPLILGNDLRHMSDGVKEILMNKEVIAIDQDALGIQGRRVVKNGDTEIWTKPLKDRSTAVALFNRGSKDTEISATWADLGLKGPQRVRDLWRHADLGQLAKGYSALVPTHGSVLLRVQKPE